MSNPLTPEAKKRLLQGSEEKPKKSWSLTLFLLIILLVLCFAYFLTSDAGKSLLETQEVRDFMSHMKARIDSLR